MKFDVKKDGVEFRHKEKIYELSQDELQAFEIEIDLIPSQGPYEEYYWIRSTSLDPIYEEMSGLVLCDLEDAIRTKIRSRKKSIAK